MNWSITSADLKGMALIAVLVLVLLISADLVKRKTGNSEWSRKTAHIGAGLLSLTFPFLFTNSFVVILLCLGFVLLMVGGRFFGVFGGVHDIDRDSVGAYVFPLIIIFCFIVSGGDPIMYCVPMLVLTVSDAVAALVGKAVGSVHYHAAGEQRSLEGSFAFFIATFLAAFLPLFFTGRTEAVLAALIGFNVAVLVTCFEAISVKGLDNIFIPLGTWYALRNFLAYDYDENVARFVLITLLAALFAGILVGARVLKAPEKVMTRTGNIGIFLCLYASFSLGGPTFFFPAGTSFMLLIILAFRAQQKGLPVEPMGLARLFQLVLTGIIILIFYDQTKAPLCYALFLAAASGGSGVTVALMANNLQKVRWFYSLVVVLMAPLTALFLMDLAPLKGFGPIGVGLLGGFVATIIADLLVPTRAIYRCEVCGETMANRRHCAKPAALIAGSGLWTESRVGWVAVLSGTLVAGVSFTLLS